jgi:Flp pilus assembly protein TadD
MQETFKEHIVARKKLLQEVSSKGRASADVLEAAFNEPQLASGTPALQGEFSVKFRRPTNEIVAAVPPVADEPPKRISEELRVTRPKTISNNPPFNPDGTPAPSGTMAAQPDPNARRKKIAMIGAGGIMLLIAILAIAKGGGGRSDTVAADATGSAAIAAGSDHLTVVIDAAVVQQVAAPDAAEVVVTPDAAEVVAAGSDTAEPPIEVETGSAGSAVRPTTKRQPAQNREPAPPKGNAQELFKSGMQAYVKGDAKTAVVQFRRALGINSSFATAWRALGFAHEKLGEWGSAKTAFQKYLGLSPNASDAAQIRERIGNL